MVVTGAQCAYRSCPVPYRCGERSGASQWPCVEPSSTESLVCSPSPPTSKPDGLDQCRCAEVHDAGVGCMEVQGPELLQLS